MLEYWARISVQNREDDCGEGWDQARSTGWRLLWPAQVGKLFEISVSGRTNVGYHRTVPLKDAAVISLRIKLCMLWS